MHWFEIILALTAAWLNLRFTRSRKAWWLPLTIWTSISLITPLADAIRLFEWCPAVQWLRAAGVIWTALLAPLLLADRLRRMSHQPVQPLRRKLLQVSAAAALTPLAGIGFAIYKANQEAKLKIVDVQVPNLHPDLRGLTLLQISDIHLSEFFTQDRLRRVIDQANHHRPHLALFTGDLITSYGDPLEEAIHELSRLKTAAGIYGCLGNHEIVAQAEDLATHLGQRKGIQFLRGRSRHLRFGQATMNLAGVDYQKRGFTYLQETSNLVRQDSFNLLLSHNPDVFPVAVNQGWDLTLAGHTHGGQVNLEFLHPSLNPARFYTPYTYGFYRQDDSALFVTSGLGTVGVPARAGTDPEIALIRLS